MQDEFRAALEAGDVAALRGLWAKIAPHLPQPQTREGAEITMHHARTQAQSVSFRARAWSHRWLTERSLPSGLPDELRPRAERLYPVVAEGVGISVNFSTPALAPAAGAIRKVMEGAVHEAYADGRTDPVHVRARMEEARAAETRRLFGALK